MNSLIHRPKRYTQNEPFGTPSAAWCGEERLFSVDRDVSRVWYASCFFAAHHELQH